MTRRDTARGAIGHPLVADVRAIVEIVADPVVILSAAGRVLSVNTPFLELTGLGRHEVIGAAAPQPWWSLRGWASGDITGGECAVEIIGRRGRRIPMVCRLSELPLRADGGHCWAAVLGAPAAAAGPGVRTPSDAGPDHVPLVAEHEALLQVARDVARGAHPAEVFRLVAREVARVLEAEAGIVWRFDDSRSTVVGTHGEHGSQLGVTFPLAGEGAVARVARTGRPARADYRAMPGDDPTAARVVHQGYTGGVAAPVSVAGRPWGAVLAATTTGRVFPPDAEERLARFAELVSLAISGAQAREDLALRATLDGLTGLLNQGEFHRRLGAEFSRARRHDRPMSLVVFDLDHFKRVNDESGHQVGDRVLKAVARTIGGVLRAEDVLARAGGEEFALILPESDGATALAVADAARLAVACIREDGLPAVTLSAGVADISDAGDPAALFSAADQALYFAKHSGRNRVQRFGPEVLASHIHDDASASRSAGLGGVRALALAVEAKDAATHRHSERVAALCCRMAAIAGWNSDRITQLRQAALVHDVGKIGVPDRILLKADRLTAAEYELVKVHPVLGASIVAEVLGAEQTSWVRHHHERFDGTGYPDGLAGTDIPDGARLLGVADAFDVMTAGRLYARARGALECLEEIRSLAGIQFCPEAVAALEQAVGVAPHG